MVRSDAPDAGVLVVGAAGDLQSAGQGVHIMLCGEFSS